MKKLLLITAAVLFTVLFQDSMHAQWVEYHADYFIDSSQNFIGEADLLTLSYGTQEIVEDPDDQENHFWRLNVHTGAADVVKYIWYPQYFNGIDKNWVPAPSTVAIKFRWMDSGDIELGPEVEIRGVYKIQFTVWKAEAGYQLEVRDWNTDSMYNLPEAFDPTEWHVLRALLDNDGNYSVYLDEGEEALATGTAGKQVDKHFFIFGAWNNSGQFGAEIDWIGVKEDAVWTPADQSLPAGIWGNPSSAPEKRQNGELKLYPNPAAELLTVAVSDRDVLSRYEILSITGRSIAQGVIGSTRHAINVTEFNPGLYLLKIETVNGARTRSFIVK